MPIYLDHSATTPLDPRVLNAMLPYFTEHFGNSLAVHSYGREPERAIEDARATVARLLNCRPHEVIFTSGGSESDNLALRGPAQLARIKNRPFTLITGPLEHKAIAQTARQLRDTLGAVLRIVNVDHFGRIDPGDLRAALTNLPADGVALVSLMLVNNEIGTVYPVAEYTAIAHEYGALVHTDAVQAPGHFPLDVAAMGADMLALSSHKFYGPKGMGVLVLREGVPFLSSLTGAKHEDYRRAGTHNTPGIVGTAAALELACAEFDTHVAHLSALRERLVQGVLDRVPDCELTGDPAVRHPGLASFVFKNVESNTLLMHLDQHGIAASSGSACKVGNPQPSAILTALGYGPEWTRGGLRLSLGRATTDAEIDTVLDVLPGVVETVRQLHWIAAD
ncbi:MAG: aminotransferase class V-fold PLP-dependent enzyme [Anaerolineae bacterium]|nr:aminotransferase class V-fold PLP-dependent enzyme [Anaerolineae bacterium]